MNNRIDQLLKERVRIEAELDEAFESEDSWPRRIQINLCSSRDSNWNLMTHGGELDGMSEDAQRTFSYALFEVLFEVDVNQDGTYTIVRARNGKQILTPES